MSARTWVVAGLSIIGANVAMEPAWHLARPSGDGCWPPDCKDAQVPLATPVVAHAGKLFMIGDGAARSRAYESTDGKHWRGFDHDAQWGARYRAAHASFAGALWLEESFRRGTMTVDSYLGGVSRSNVKLPPPPPELLKEFDANTGRSIDLARQKIAATPRDPDA